MGSSLRKCPAAQTRAHYQSLKVTIGILKEYRECTWLPLACFVCCLPIKVAEEVSLQHPVSCVAFRSDSPSSSTRWHLPKTCPTASLYWSHTSCTHIAHTTSTFTTHPVQKAHTSYLLSLLTPICHTLHVLALTPHTYPHSLHIAHTPRILAMYPLRVCTTFPSLIHTLYTLGVSHTSHRSHNAASEASSESAL